MSQQQQEHMETTTPNPPPPPTTTLSKEEMEEHTRFDRWLVDQMNKKYPKHYYPMDPDPASDMPTRITTTTVGNYWVDGEGLLTCDPCVVHISFNDETAWNDLKGLVHFAVVSDELKTGPDVHQCFCGYLSMRAEDLETHLGEKERQAHDETLKVVLNRFKSGLKHDECYAQLEDFVLRREYKRRPGQEEYDPFNRDPNYDDGRIVVDHAK